MSLPLSFRPITFFWGGCYRSAHLFASYSMKAILPFESNWQNSGRFFFLFSPLFYGITGQKGQKLVLMGFFLTLELLQLSASMERSHRNQIWWASPWILWSVEVHQQLPTGMPWVPFTALARRRGTCLCKYCGWDESVWSHRLHRASSRTTCVASSPCPAHYINNIVTCVTPLLKLSLFTFFWPTGWWHEAAVKSVLL